MGFSGREPLQLDSKDQEALRAYLLGSLPPEEVAPFEERLITDGALYQELLIVEDELVDQYLSDELSPTECEGFEKHFLLAAERQQKVRFSRTLKKYLSNTGEAQTKEAIAAAVSSNAPASIADPGSEKQPFFSFLSRKPILAYSLAAALVLVLVAVSVNRWKNPGYHEPGQVLAVVLTPGLTRDGGEIKKISIPPGTDTLQLRLELPNSEYATYRAELLTVERSVSVTEGLQLETTAVNKFITVPISTTLVKPNDYYLKLGGKRADGTYEDVASYVFRVVN